MNLRLGENGYVLKLDVEEVNRLKTGEQLETVVSTAPAFSISVGPGQATMLDAGASGIAIALTESDLADLLELGSNRDGILLEGAGWQMRMQIDIRSTRPRRNRAQMAGDRDKGLGFRRSAGAVNPEAQGKRR